MPGPKKQMLEGSDFIFARLEAERAELLNSGVLFVFLGTIATIPMAAVLLTGSFNTRTGLAMTGVAVLWGTLMLGLWAGFRAYFEWSRRWLLKRRALLPAPAARQRNRKARQGLLVSLASFICIGPLPILFATKQWDRAPAFALMFVQTIGYVLIYLGLFGSRGDEPRCATCAYDVGDDPEAWLTCPECGSDLAKPFGVVLGDRTRRWWLVGLGAAIIWAVQLGIALL